MEDENTISKSSIAGSPGARQAHKASPALPDSALPTTPHCALPAAAGGQQQQQVAAGAGADGSQRTGDNSEGGGDGNASARRPNDMLVFAFDESDDEEDEPVFDGNAGSFSDDSGAYEDCDRMGPLPAARQSSQRSDERRAGSESDDMPSLVSRFATSLPVTIPGRYWPPPDAVDSVERRRRGKLNTDGDAAEGEEGAGDDTAYPPHREPAVPGDLSTLARSVQPADDPERLFGERPRRRTYYQRIDERRLRPPPPSAASSTDCELANGAKPMECGGGGGEQ